MQATVVATARAVARIAAAALRALEREHRLDPAPHERLIVGDEDLDRLHARIRPYGSATRTSGVIWRLSARRARAA
jgi:hypothetical protein